MAGTHSPAEQLLHSSFEMEPAVLPERPTAAHRRAMCEGAVVLSEEDLEITLAELRDR